MLAGAGMEGGFGGSALAPCSPESPRCAVAAPCGVEAPGPVLGGGGGVRAEFSRPLTCPTAGLDTTV